MKGSVYSELAELIDSNGVVTAPWIPYSVRQRIVTWLKYYLNIFLKVNLRMETEYQWSIWSEIRVHALPDGTREADGSLTQNEILLGRWKNINVSLSIYEIASTE